MVRAATQNRERMICKIMGFDEDSKIASETDIQDRFQRSPYLPLRNIECRLDDGVLVLRGRVPTFYLKQLAQSVGHSLKGIHRVVNELLVDFPRRNAYE
jgi:osmotically-inducible protein OsmY